jgi:hypothetical protein
MHHHHHHHESYQGLRINASSFKAQGVLYLSTFVYIFPYNAVPDVGTQYNTKSRPTIILRNLCAIVFS